MNIGFFDTGLGGATIFKEAYNKISADFIYLADNLNSPYGTKDIKTVQELTEDCVVKLIEENCKIIVIACNTATSSAIDYLREKYIDIIFIGTEPAIKPALQNSKNKKVLITATSLTIHGKKLENLVKDLNGTNNVEYLALDKLVEFADKYSEIRYDLAKEYLINEFSKFDLNNFSGIVLGCTHFPIFKDVISDIVPDEITLYDSALGVTTNLKNKLGDIISSEKSVKLILTQDSKNLENNFYKIIN